LSLVVEHDPEKRGRDVMNRPNVVPGRSAVLLATCALLLGTNLAIAWEVRTTASGAIVRPDRQGYTSFWDWGPGAGLGAEVFPDKSGFGIALWAEFAELPGRTRGIFGDTITVSPWQQARVFAGIRGRIHPVREARGFSITADLALGRGVLDFGEVRTQGPIQPQFYPANRQWGGMFTFGAGLEFVGEKFGVFVDVRSEAAMAPNFYTWNTKRIGLIWRARRHEE
jgi:hypothetical protein